MDTGLLATKLRLPIISPRLVDRPRLFRRLDDGLEAGRQITLVSAPAGFGKTVCISAWLNRLDRPAAWLSLDPSDDEPGRFFTYLIAALQKLEARLGREIDPVLRSGQLPPLEMISTALINDLADCSGRFVLALDDLQVIQDATILQVLDRLASNLPPALHLVLLTREDPPLPLARLRAHNCLTELRAADLRFTPGEARDFLQQVMGIRLADADIAALEERTEGWAAGLQLAALALQSPAADGALSDPSGWIAALTGSHRYILGYLTSEVLNRQPQDVRRFLLQTSILDRLCGELCDAVTGQSGSRLLLERLHASNLFLVPLDDEGRWYRYHHLFADLLRDIQTAQGRSELAGLYRRAALWYSQAADVEAQPRSACAEYAGEAIHLALAAEDYALAVQLIEQHAMDLIMQWYARTVESWMAAIPSKWSAHSPRANLAFAWSYLLHGAFLQAAPYIDRLQEIFAGAEIGDPALRAEWLALQSTLLGAQGKPLESLELAGRALKIAPEADAYVRSLIYLSMAGAYQQLDQLEPAIQAYRYLVQYGRLAGELVPELLGRSSLGLLALHRGRLQEALDWAVQGIRQAEHTGSLPPICTAIFGEAGQVYFHRHQLDLAQANFQRSIDVCRLSGYGDAEIYAHVINSQLAQMRRDLEAAQAEIRLAVEIMRRLTAYAVSEEVVAQQVRVALALDHLPEAEAALQEYALAASGGSPLAALDAQRDLTYPQALMYTAALRLQIYRLERYGDRAALAAAQTLADSLLSVARRREYLTIVLEALLLRSRIHTSMRLDQASLDDVSEALKLAEPEGYISIFVEGGPLIGQAAAKLAAGGSPGSASLAFTRRVLEHFPGLSPSADEPPDIDPKSVHPQPESNLIAALTDRELEVLRAMAAGMTYAEISQELFISLNTVRTHVKAIYAKLNVDNRTRAIEQARRLKLL